MRYKSHFRLTRFLKIISFLLAILFIATEALWVSRHREEDYSRLKPYFEMVSGGYSSKQFTENNQLSLSYWVEAKYPAEPVSLFYENSFREKGWVLVSPPEWGPQRTWTFGLRPDPKTGQLECSYSYLASWTNGSKDRLLQMTLVYYESGGGTPCPAGPRGDELSVTIREMDFKS